MRPLRALAARCLAAARIAQRTEDASRFGMYKECALHARWLVDAATAKHADPVQAQNAVRGMVERVARHEPLAYVLGTQPFGPLELCVRAPVLIPRPETEDWTLALAERLRSAGPLRILDLCTGSGCIAILLAHTLRTTDLLAVDLDPACVALAAENARRCQVRIATRRVDLFDDAAMLSLGAFDLVVCNPPYIPSCDYTSLHQSVRAFESRSALVGSHAENDGLLYYRRLVELLPRGLLRPSASPFQLVVEVGAGQADAVQKLFAPIGGCAQWQDPWGHQRVVALRS
ncbi:hypothetical protein MVES1_002686 [Malassezia vespertilionis]|uniref:peptide chain release factor N(5)-glutamine methyltransferase n=1 Tax=Malassezia vespertilionis TaxID=2020962 RepID=A0A2N1JA76_9BASI|nr:uncharacterized protein MVES1_002686 [Malassezia vespertilionis]PKI83454.1 hypothetical protein MVES_002535 [Malassezia vespertilionis]WFD07323.1 hypothetical protein MVES1_002686 [Malassezia vespertilionis]